VKPVDGAVRQFLPWQNYINLLHVRSDFYAKLTKPGSSYRHRETHTIWANYRDFSVISRLPARSTLDLAAMQNLLSQQVESPIDHALRRVSGGRRERDRIESAAPDCLTADGRSRSAPRSGKGGIGADP
jgi:hypothetical protein